MSWRRPQLRRCGEEGSAAVETALIMTVLLLLVVGSAEFAQALWTYNTMLLAVEEAGRYAMVYEHSAPATCAAQTQAPDCPLLSNTPLANCAAGQAQQVLSAYRLSNIAVSVSEDITSNPAMITVCARHSFDFLAPQLLPYGSLDLITRVTVPLI